MSVKILSHIFLKKTIKMEVTNPRQNRLPPEYSHRL